MRKVISIILNGKVRGLSVCYESSFSLPLALLFPIFRYFVFHVL